MLLESFMRSAIVVVLLGLVAGGCDRQSPSAPQGNAATAAPATSPDEVPPPSPDEATGSTAPAAKGFDRSHKGEPAPTHVFTAPNGKPTTLAAYKGRPVLVNLWATWCAPCITELPSLDALAARPGGPRVLAISQDMDAAKVQPFWAGRKLRTLQPSLDPKMAWSTGMAVNLPTTILYDGGGREVWRYSGVLDWAGPEAAKALAEAA
jgi:thiol-disulfide isomerase/thioredoxin